MSAADHTSNFDRLEPPLRSAVQAALDEPMPEEAIARVKQRASKLESPAIWRNQPYPWRRITWLSASVAAGLLVTLLLIPSNRLSAFAEIVDAVAKKTWLHAHGTGPDGQSAEIWFSAKEGIIAFRGNDNFLFVDRRRGTMDVFGKPAGSDSIERFPLKNVPTGGVDATHQAFLALLSGDLEAAVQRADQSLLEHASKTVRVDGRALVEHRIVVGAKNQEQSRTENLLCADPHTRLPVSWRMRHGDRTVFDFRVSYPERGPMTIQALGVPDSTPLVDRAPTLEFKQILDATRAVRRRFDDYRGVVINSRSSDRARGGNLGYRIWRKGNRWRVDQFRLTVGNRDEAPKEVNPDAWWLEQARTMKSYPREVWDGEQLWSFSPIYTEPRQDDPDDPRFLRIDSLKATARSRGDRDDPQSERYMAELPEFYGYEPLGLGASIGFRAETRTAQREGRPLTLVDIIQTSNVSSDSTSPRRFWLDAQRGNLIVCKESFRVANPKEPIGVSEVVEAARTPNGIWYPTTVRMVGNTILPDGSRGDSFVRYYLEFGADVPDELFDAAAVDKKNIWTKLP